jgi:exodeoxyribonuclease V beta subunit
MKDRINEMEFYFPLNPVSSRNLATAFSRYGHRAMSADFAAQIERLNLAPSRGFMKGYIDLVFQHQQRFYLVDWKSNYLGPSYESYSQVSLQQTMQAEYYILQYHLYTLALHLHLSRRKKNYQYEPDFGGIFYIFLRGVDTDRGSEYGIFFDRPNLKFIDALGRTLIPGYPGDQK